MVTPHAREAAGVVITDAEDKAMASKATVKVADMVMVRVARITEMTGEIAKATTRATTIKARVMVKAEVRAKAVVMVITTITMASAGKAAGARDVTTIRVVARVVMVINNAATIRARGTTSLALPLTSLHRPSPMLSLVPMCQAKSSSWHPRHQASYRLPASPAFWNYTPRAMAFSVSSSGTFKPNWVTPTSATTSSNASISPPAS